MDKELAITPILSEKFDSLLLDVRNLPTRQRVSCLLQISYKNEEGIDGISKQEKLLTEALSLTPSSKDRKKILLQLLTVYNKLDNWRVPDTYSKGIHCFNELEKHFSLSQEEEWQVKKTKALLLNRRGKQEEYLPIWFELLKEHRTANKTQYIIEDLYAIANHFEKLGNFTQALPLYEEAYQLTQNKQTVKLQEQCFVQLIGVLYNDGHYAKTIEYCNNTKNDSIYIKNPAIKNFLAKSYLQLNQTDSARFYLYQQLASSTGDFTNLNLQIADSYIIEQNEDSASFYITKATNMFKERSQRYQNNNVLLPPYFLQTYSSFAELLQKKGKAQEANRLFAFIEPLMREEMTDPSQLELQIKALTGFSTFCRSTKQYEKALDLIAHRDSIQLIYNDIQKKRDSKNLAGRFEIQELTHTIHIKETTLVYAQRLLIICMTSGIVLALIGSVLFYLYRKQRKQIKAIYEQYEKWHRTEERLLTTKETDPDKLLYVRANNLVIEKKLFLDDKINVVILAEMLKTNRTYLSKAINTCTGDNFSTWFNGFRVNYAIKIMRNDPFIEIKTLAAKCGFSSTETFNRNFVLHCGIKPREYQKQIMIEQNTLQKDEDTQDKEI